MEGVPPEVVLALPFREQKAEGLITHHAAFLVGSGA